MESGLNGGSPSANCTCTLQSLAPLQTIGVLTLCCILLKVYLIFVWCSWCYFENELNFNVYNYKPMSTAIPRKK